MEGLALTSFWRGRRVLLTGHTGFKGAWLATWLCREGAEVTGLALAPETSPNLWDLVAPTLALEDRRGDVRDPDEVRAAVAASRPEVVLHLAAQALVPRSLREPAATFDVNVRGLSCVLDAVLEAGSARAVLVVTSDKVYDERSPRPYVEGAALGGRDPYSASKACAELVVGSYRASFFDHAGIALATARSGNVIGGGDWSADRLVPDVVRSARSGEPVVLRRPDATRPWQHVLDPLRGYLLHVEAAASGRGYVPALNFGPALESCVPARSVVDGLAATWPAVSGWVPADQPSTIEAGELELDSSAAGAALGWRPLLALDEALAWTAEWYREHERGADAARLTVAQIEAYQELAA